MIAESTAAAIATGFCLVGLAAGFLGGWCWKEWHDRHDPRV